MSGGVGPAAVDDLVTHVKKASALGRHEPFVGAGTVKITSNFFDVDGHHSGNLGAVNHGDDSFAACQGGDFFDREDDSGDGGDVADEDDLGLGSDGGFNQL